MSQVNLNPTAQAPTLLPVPVPRRMSLTAKVISALALLFFAAFAYVAATRRTMPPTSGDSKDNDRVAADNPPDSSLKKTYGVLISAAWEFDLNGEKEGLRQSFIGATPTLEINGRLIDFIAQCRCDFPSVVISDEAKQLTDSKRNELATEERKKCEAAYKEAERIDLKQAEMNQDLTTLVDELKGAIRILEDRLEKLGPAGHCYARYCTAGGGALTLEELDRFEKRDNVTEDVIAALQEALPQDLFKERVAKFFAAYPEASFEGKRTELQQSYENYLAAIKRVENGVKWKEVRKEASS